MFKEQIDFGSASPKSAITFTPMRLIALWGFSESALGGLLHALKIPFTGLFVGGVAVMIITLIGFYCRKPGEIIKATFIVLSIKLMVSPHSPLTAYLAVFLQGVVGEVLFFIFAYKSLAGFFLSFVTMFLASIQKVIVTTLVFGQAIWESIDTFGQFVTRQLAFLNFSESFYLSHYLIGIYMGIHIFGGILIGIFSVRLPKWINERLQKPLPSYQIIDNGTLYGKKKKGKYWWKKKSSILLFIFSVVMIILSYTYSDIDVNEGERVIIMMIRAVLILFLWFTFLSPILFKWFSGVLQKHKNRYSNELRKILNDFPRLKGIVHAAWKDSEKSKYILRLKLFLSTVIALLLVVDE